MTTKKVKKTFKGTLDDLTDKQAVFAQYYATTGDKIYAAHRAGYGVPENAANIEMKKPSVITEVLRVSTEQLFTEALPAAVGCLIRILNDEHAGATARVQAAKVVLERTIGAAENAREAQPHEMTPEQLGQAIAQLQSQIDTARQMRMTSPVIQGAAVSVDDGCAHGVGGDDD